MTEGGSEVYRTGWGLKNILTQKGQSQNTLYTYFPTGTFQNM